MLDDGKPISKNAGEFDFLDEDFEQEDFSAPQPQAQPEQAFQPDPEEMTQEGPIPVPSDEIPTAPVALPGAVPIPKTVPKTQVTPAQPKVEDEKPAWEVMPWDEDFDVETFETKPKPEPA